MFHRFAQTFLAGLLSLLPLVITFWLVGYVIANVNSSVGTSSTFGQLLQTIINPEHLWLAYSGCLVFVVLVIWIIGHFTKSILSRRFTMWLGHAVSRVPLISSIYTGVDQLTDLFKHRHEPSEATLEHAVMIKQGDNLQIGMLASAEKISIENKLYYMVYVPSIPIPTSGDHYLALCEDVTELNLTTEEVTRIFISLGTLGAKIMNSKKQLINA